MKKAMETTVTASPQQGQAPARKSRQILSQALKQKEGSPEERQLFEQYLDALHDEHAQ